MLAGHAGAPTQAEYTVYSFPVLCFLSAHSPRLNPVCVCFELCAWPQTEISHEVSSAVVHEVPKYLISPESVLGKITSRRPWYDYLIEPITVHKTDLHIYIYISTYIIKER